MTSQYTSRKFTTLVKKHYNNCQVAYQWRVEIGVNLKLVRTEIESERMQQMTQIKSTARISRIAIQARFHRLVAGQCRF